MHRPARRQAYSSIHRWKSGRSICAALTVAALSAAALTGCTSTDNKGPEATLGPSDPATSPKASSTPSASPSPSATGEAAEVQRAYEGYWKATVAAYAKGAIEGTDIKKYAVAEALSDTKSDVVGLKQQGYVARGKPSLSPKYGGVDDSRKTPRSTFTDCVDITKWTLVKKSNGEEVQLPKERLTRYVSNVIAEKWYGHWVIVRATQEEKKC
ncbi:hypothetical protein [Streptomyces longhuiensis]|uniref:hypothetical protein n=1 Tax=Streptomyces longhuiensis TaxID=2880933 RepID=UPI001D0A539E|nr:hypothetical protein [Streptomyces longhuiensis]UDL96818.1 hypothetical protein LGI35_00035 [Streptomyces longhuiensis]